MTTFAETVRGPDELVLAVARLMIASETGRTLPAGDRVELCAMSRQLATAIAPLRYGARVREDAGFQDFVRTLIGDLFGALRSSTEQQIRSFHELLKAACRASAQDSGLLTTLVLLGLQRVVVPSGEVDTRLRLAMHQLSAGQAPRLVVGNTEDVAELGRVALRFHSEVLPLTPFAGSERTASWRRLTVEDGCRS